MLLLGSYTINISGRFPPTKYKIQVKDVSFPDNNKVMQKELWFRINIFCLEPYFKKQAYN